MPFVKALVPEVDLDGGRVVIVDRPGLVTPLPETATRDAAGLVTIFPDYLAPLQLSLLGRRRGARADRRAGPRPARLDPRPAPHRRRHARTAVGRHGDEARAVGRGLRRLGDRRRDRRVPDARGAAVHPGPGARARDPSGWCSLCGRYEGIDQRVLDQPPTQRRVRRVSLGDYVLNGGEVAALAIIEAVCACCPGSSATRSRSPRSPTRTACWSTPSTPSPPSWRGLDVPAVLLSGDHGAIARWRHDQARRRTARAPARPAAPAAPSRTWRGRAGDARRRRRAAHAPARLLGPGGLANGTLGDVPALHESLEDVVAWMDDVVHRGWSAPGADGRFGARTARGRHLGGGPADGRPRTSRAAVWAGCCSPTSRRWRRPRRRRTCCSPAPAARTTSGCTRKAGYRLRRDLQAPPSRGRADQTTNFVRLAPSPFNPGI